MTGELRRHLAALLSADVVGYSRLMTDDEQATVAILEQYRAAMAALVAQHEGRVVNLVGDNVLAEFHSVVDAVASAMDVQRELARRNEALPDSRRMQWRIGVNLGDIMVDGEDVYGDGINIAARLESMAEPGGICISGTVREQIRGKIACDFEDLGDQSLKNIEYPVRVFRIRVAESAPASEGTGPARADAATADARDLTVPGFAGKPAIAVLAFDNLSTDPEQAYLADGIAEDLITGLALARQYPVIARNSSFVYKGRSVDVKEISRDLGVRYVVEGSVRRAGDRIRVTAQLIDAVSGHHVWAERYDRDLKDLFDLQDELVEAMLGALAPALSVSERQRVSRKHVADHNAWECLVRASAMLLESNGAPTEQMDEAERWYERALSLDPRLSDAYLGLAYVYVFRLVNADREDTADLLAKLAVAADRAIEIAPGEPSAHMTRAVACNFGGNPQGGVESADRALAINPSLAIAHTTRGSALWMSGQAEAAIPAIEKAIRLSPNDPARFMMDLHLASAHLVAGRFQDAVRYARKAIQAAPNYAGVVRTFAVCCAYAGYQEEALAAWRRHESMVPDFDVERLRLFFPAFYADRVSEGLRMARCGESPPPGGGSVR